MATSTATPAAPQLLSADEAMRYTQCRPDRFTAWYRVSNGSDLSEVVAQLQRQLMTTTEPVTEGTTDTITSTDATKLMPEETTGSGRIPDLFSGSGENATEALFSSSTETSTATESFVTVPPTESGKKKRRKRHIATGDRVTGFIPIRRAFNERFLNEGDPELNPRPDFNPPIYRQNTRAIINTDSTEYYNPAVYIRRSKFFQGMDAGINLFTNHGAYVEIHDTLMVASRGGVSLQLGQSVVDVIGSTIVGCNRPISLDDFTNLGRMPVDEDEFCPVKSPSSFTSGYYGANNQINFHRTTFKGTFLTLEGAMRFWSDTLKTGRGQNTENQRVDLQGPLCRGFLRRNTAGAVQVGHELCPPQALPLNLFSLFHQPLRSPIARRPM